MLRGERVLRGGIPESGASSGARTSGLVKRASLTGNGAASPEPSHE